MTKQEAIKWIDGRMLELSCIADITSSDKGMQRINEEFNALLHARAALEKRIPEKPEIKETEKAAVRFGEFGVHKRTRFCCQTCGKLLYVQNHFEYENENKSGFDRWPAGSRTPFCPACGQSLKWEEGRP